MVGILFIVALCLSNAKIAKQKGRKPGLFVFYTILMSVAFFFAYILFAAGIIASGGSDTLASVVGVLIWVLGTSISTIIVKKAKPGEDFERMTNSVVNPDAANDTQPVNKQINATWEAPKDLEKDDLTQE